MRTMSNLSQTNKQHVLSVDLFRGLVILVMIFVNDIASVTGLPWWTYHYPADQNGMTYVDVVLPAFLFIVGIVIPLAIQRRLNQQCSKKQISLHIVTRSLTLVVFGLLIMNGRELDPDLSGTHYSVWNVFMFIGAILYLNHWDFRHNRGLKLAAKWGGLSIIIAMLFLYKRNANGEAAWLDLENWATLGAIGWSYLSACIVIYLARSRLIGLIIGFTLLVTLSVTVSSGFIDYHSLPYPLLWPFRAGSYASIVMAGVITSKLLLSDQIAKTVEHKIMWALITAFVLAVAAWLLLPFGLSKATGTPSYALFSTAISIVLFTGMYYLVDVADIKRWGFILKPAGANALLLFILPDIYYAMFSINHFADIAGSGWQGVVRGLIFTVFIFGIGTVMSRIGIRLQL